MTSIKRQTGDAGVGMLVLMIALMATFLWAGGMGHGKGHSEHAAAESTESRDAALQLHDESAAEGDAAISPGTPQQQSKALIDVDARQTQR